MDWAFSRARAPQAEPQAQVQTSLAQEPPDRTKGDTLLLLPNVATKPMESVGEDTLDLPGRQTGSLADLGIGQLIVAFGGEYPRMERRSRS
ncbi:hypothetical protein [Allosphingosinicella sp.]|uniref:hypothetical protein n=1 Tax=Allosphingosinicella sp. TaxID=2823234 RepID=UPI002FC1DB24